MWGNESRNADDIAKLLAEYRFLRSNATIDWLTITSQSDNVADMMFRNFHKYHDFLTEVGKETPPWKDWKFHGFNGVIGCYNHLKFGTRFEGIHQRHIFIASGEMAGVLFPEFAPHKKRVTRLDLAVSGYLKKPALDLAEQHKARLDALFKDWQNRGEVEREWPRKWTSPGATPTWGVYANKWGSGQTLYLGSRQSDTYARLYDKGAQLGTVEPGLLWRYELQLNRGVADGAAKELWGLLQGGAKGVNERWARMIRYVVGEYFKDRGVTPGFDYDQLNHRLETDVTVTSDDRKLNWLRSGVAPSISDLISRGFGREVASALGLERWIDVEQLEIDFGPKVGDNHPKKEA